MTHSPKSIANDSTELSACSFRVILIIGKMGSFGVWNPAEGWRSSPVHGLKLQKMRKQFQMVQAVSVERTQLTQLEKGDLKGQTITVLGLGASGRAAAQLALARGASVVAVDNNRSLIPLEVLNKEGCIGFELLVESLQYHRAVITFGASGKKIRETLDDAGISIPCSDVATLRDAVSMARSFAKHGDVILLSPGCASFDEFDNFEHRGRVFQELARLSL